MQTVEPRTTDFPLDHISASAIVKFCSNPVLFKIFYLNRDKLSYPMGVSAVIGSAFHTAMETYYNEGCDVAKGLQAGAEYLDLYNENFIRFTQEVSTRQQAIERFTFAYNAYINESPKTTDKVIACEDLIIETVDVEWRGSKYHFPVPLKGSIDKLIERGEKLIIVDYKTCKTFSDPERIDGAKIIQAIEYFFLVFAKYGRAPYSLIYEEVKAVKNRDGSPQVKRYEVIYEENPDYFELYLRIFGDFVRAMNGEMVYPPNLHALFDNEIAIIAYLQHLDDADEVARRIKKEKVTNITELLRRDIAKASNLSKLMQYAKRSIAETSTIDYASMQVHEKIQTKLLEHGMIIKFDSMVEGCSVNLYRFIPSIGIKMATLRNYSADIEQVIGKSGVRILAPIPNSTLIGVEIPKEERLFPEVPEVKEGFMVAIGRNTFGEDVRIDLRKAPHLLVAGSTGSGKSVFLNSLIRQITAYKRADLVLLDPKRVELAEHKDKGEYYNTFDDIVEKLQSLCDLMELRYKYLEKVGLKDIDDTDLPYIFVILDEFGEISTKGSFSKDRSLNPMSLVLRLAQLARASGIHLILATQRPSVDIISGPIKTNLPTKVCFRVANMVDSRVVLDEAGAEKLLGKGDMLFSSVAGIERLQGYKS